MEYQIFHTYLGLQLLAQAQATGSKIEITHMAVGDGGGNAIIPDPSMKQLVRERFRSTVNRVYQDPENKNLFTAELIIPVEVDGFVVREIAVFDRNGNMLMIGNTPEVQKPTKAEGAFTDSIYRIPFIVSNAEIINPQIDPNVIVATQSWIVNTLTTAFFFPGGVTGQVLKKKSNKDGDIGWGDAGEAEIFVTTIEEEQTLVADQLIIDLKTVTSTGVAIYINGERITNKSGSDGWIATSATQITLGKAYPDSKILIVQNEPLGAAPYPLAQKNNLSDIQDKTLARQNLGVMSVEDAKYNDCPPGTMVTLATANIPTGYRLLKANGANVSRTAYAELFAVIGTYFGAGDGVNTFTLPDARGEFPRYADDGRGIDVGRAVGSKQSQQVLKHQHFTFGEAPSGWPFGISEKKGFMGSKGNIDYDNYLYLSNDGTDYQNQTANASGIVGNENRPRNIAWLACIRY